MLSPIPHSVQIYVALVIVSLAIAIRFDSSSYETSVRYVLMTAASEKDVVFDRTAWRRIYQGNDSDRTCVFSNATLESEANEC